MAAAHAVSTLPDLLLEEFPLLGDRKQLIDRVSAFAKDLVASRPEEGGDAEFETLCEFTELHAQLLDEVSEIRWSTALRLAAEKQLDSLILAEYASAQVEKKLALRHLQTAAETCGELLGLIAGMYETLPSEPLLDLIKDLYTRPPRVIVEQPGTRLWSRVFVALLVGSEAANVGELADLTFWSNRALTSSRQARASLVREAGALQGTRARLKTDIAWADWDDEEIATESASWQDL